ncbi:hypothetical protein H2200_008812 [Cladophialophora chaetospira]|uniref:Uncharacterized protein n=1 Tax=Cladophialophora chaetospira TaxID=386627 RepID=A0AA39CG27_9EURO|nr:hypothetical protein H2200_008812 [Cladophialophora chaetospira]
MAANTIVKGDPIAIEQAIRSQHATIDSSVVVDQAVRGVKRSHQGAFEYDDNGYGGLRPMTMRGYSGRRRPQLATAQPLQQPRRVSALKSYLKPQKGDDEGASELKDARSAVRFNEAVQTLWFSPNNIVGDDEGLETTCVSEEHSPEWQAYLERRAVSKRNSLRQHAQYGSLRSCIVYMTSQNRATGVPASHESDDDPRGLLQHPMFRYTAGYIACSSEPTPTEVEVLHVNNEELLRQALGVVDAVNHGEIKSPLSLSASHYKEVVKDIFRANGMMSPYHAGVPTHEVTDARKDDDWSELQARAASLSKACPTVSTVRAIEQLLEMFKR